MSGVSLDQALLCFSSWHFQVMSCPCVLVFLSSNFHVLVFSESFRVLDFFQVISRSRPRGFFSSHFVLCLVQDILHPLFEIIFRPLADLFMSFQVLAFSSNFVYILDDF